MFNIVNIQTGKSTEVGNKDALFSEIENANARSKALKEKYDYKIFNLNQDGEILEEIEISTPFESYVDELLSNFGNKRQKKGISFSFGKLFKHASKAGSNVSIPIQPVLVEKPSNEDTPTKKYEITSESQSQLPDLEELSHQINDSESSEDLIEIDSVKTDNSQLPDEQNVKSPKPADIELTPKQHEFNEVQTRNVESLSTYDLQFEFTNRIKSEISSIDEEIERLIRKKSEHQKLLSTLETVKLS